MQKFSVGILGATGMVGQRFVTLLSRHPWFDVTVLAASPRSRGKTFAVAVKGRWAMAEPIPAKLAKQKVLGVEDDLDQIASTVDLVFSAMDLDKEVIKVIENDYAAAGVAVVSNNSAHRWTEDVPVLLPEVNPGHLKLIDIQRMKRKWTTGLIAVKPNCSIQSYVPILSALKEFGPTKVQVTMLQSISGAGKTFETWPEMIDNVIPFIGGEEEKSQKEPLKVWASLSGQQLRLPKAPVISATCIRVPTTDGHMASLSFNLEKKTTQRHLLDAVVNYPNPLAGLGLPSAPKQFITYFEELDRPQTKLDRDIKNGMGITMGRLRQGVHFDWECIGLSHNTIRGAAGGAILMAELLAKKGYIIRTP